MSYCVTLYGFQSDVKMQLAKPAGLSQYSDTLNDDEDVEEEEAEKGEMGKADGDEKHESLSRCAFVARSIWTQAVFWQIYYSRPVLNFELCASIYRRNCFTPLSA